MWTGFFLDLCIQNDAGHFICTGRTRRNMTCFFSTKSQMEEGK